MKKSELKQLIREEIKFIIKENSETYPFNPSSEKVALYNKIANELKKTNLLISQTLNIPKSDIRIILDNLWSENQDNKRKGLFIQIKPSTDTWKKPWKGNQLIMQTPNGDGVVISTSGIRLNDNSDFTEELINIYSIAKKQNLSNTVSKENLRIFNMLTSEELELIAPNTPIIITGE